MENSPRFVHNTEAKEGETSQMPFMEQNSDDASKGSSLAQPLRPPSNPRGLEAAPQSKAPDFPDGGLTAWLQVLGCFFLWFNSWGLTNAFGVFQTYYQSDLLHDHTPSQIAWIGAVQAYILIFFGVLTGPAYDAGYFHQILWLGSFLVVFGFMMLSLCTQYWQVMLAQGLVVGFGTACLFTLSAIILPQYFLKKRALANGIAASGSSMGGVIYPIAVYKLLTQVGFEWTARIVGFIALGTCAISIALLRQRVKTPKKRILFDPKALLELPFFFFTVSFIFGLMGLYVPSFFIQSFAIEKGIITGELSAYVLPILNAAGVFGRVVPNFFADRTGPLNMLTPCLAGAGLLCLAWIAVANEGGLIVIALLFGFFSGAILSLPIIGIVSLSPSLAVIGTRLGTCSAIASLGLLVGTPVSGAILGTNGNYVGLQAFAGVVLLVAAVCCGVARVLKAGPRIIVKA